MNSSVQQVRQAVVGKVSNIRKYAKWHPDSTTGITAFTVDSVAGSGVDSDISDVDDVSAEASHPVRDSPVENDAMSAISEESEDGGISLL